MQLIRQAWSALFFITFSTLLVVPKIAGADDLTAWIKENALYIDSLDSGKDFPQLAALDQAIENKKIVFLGEASHWVHEKYDYRLILLNRLVARGFTNIGMEMGFSDGQRVDQFIETGELADLDRLALYGHRSKTVRSRFIPSKCEAEKKVYPQFADLFKKEEVWFYSNLRKAGLNKLPIKSRIHHFGFDVDTIPGGGYEDAENLLKDFLGKPLITQLTNLLEVPEGESNIQEIARLEKALASVDANSGSLSSIMGSKKFKTLRLTLHVLIESIRFINVYNSKPCDQAESAEWNKKVMAAMAARERVMFEIAKAKVEELGPNAKIVLMGHDFHLSKNPGSLRFTGTEIPDQWAPHMWPSIGQYVSKTLGLPTYSVWMMQAIGFQSNTDCPLQECPINSGENYLGTWLGRAGKNFFLPLRQPPDILNERINFSVNGGTHSANVVENADAIFFVETVSGLRSRE